MDVFNVLSKVYTGVTLPLYYPFTRDSSIEATSGQLKAKRDGNTWSRIDEEDHENILPDYESFAHLVRDASQKFEHKRALGYRKLMKKEKGADGKSKLLLAPEYTWITHRDLNERITNIMKGLLAANVKPKDNVSIYMETRVEWLLVAEAVFRMNATIATLYATLGEEGMIHGINELGSSHIVTSNDLLPKLLKLKSKLPNLHTIIVVRDVVDGVPEQLTVNQIDGCNILLLEDLENNSHPGIDVSTVQMPTPEDVAVIMYTSGSTGIPKGVILRHKNFTDGLKNLTATFVKAGFSEDATHLAYLPLAHIFELQATHIFLALGLGVGFASPNTLLSTSPGLMAGSLADIAVLKPEMMAAVPLMLDRVRKAVDEKFVQRGAFARSIFDYALDYKTSWNQYGFRTPLVDRLIMKKISNLFGGRLKVICSGGAKLSPDTQMFAKNTLGASVMVVFAATETAGSGTLMDVNDNDIGTVGPPQYGTQIRLENWEKGGYLLTDQPNPRGEILVKSKSVASGYYNRPEETAESFIPDADGSYWFRTGDIGEVTPEGSLKIIDRKNDLVKLQFGEYISPGRIEAELKCCPIVDNMCVIADGNYNYTVAVVVPNVSALKQMSRERSSSSLEELCADDKVNEAALKEIRSYAVKSKLMKYEVPDKIKLVAETWTPDSGLVTAALKIRRKEIKAFYKDIIERLYT